MYAAVPESDVPLGLVNGDRRVLSPRVAAGCRGGSSSPPFCVGLRFLGTAFFSKRDNGKATYSFQLYAYQDARSAAAAYDANVAYDSADGALTEVPLGPVGEKRDGRRGRHPVLDEPRVTAHVLVGTTVLRIEAFGSPQSVSDDRLRQLARMFAESARARQEGAAPKV
ncbi:hypothetical protein CGZ69_28060 [Streptomyces peucetius subsp. caesius ATCC 27952]|nr:hypothetical protein CGZ69_28060 [Streptomyces peucetius subsp. caesius ATCC 27952]